MEFKEDKDNEVKSKQNHKLDSAKTKKNASIKETEGINDTDFVVLFKIKCNNKKISKLRKYHNKYFFKYITKIKLLYERGTV